MKKGKEIRCARDGGNRQAQDLSTEVQTARVSDRHGGRGRSSLVWGRGSDFGHNCCPLSAAPYCEASVLDM